MEFFPAYWWLLPALRGAVGVRPWGSGRYNSKATSRRHRQYLPAPALFGPVESAVPIGVAPAQQSGFEDAAGVVATPDGNVR